MLIYEIQCLPDLSLSKYQVFADSGIDGMLEVQTQFIKQMHRILLLGSVSLHFLFIYNPKYKSGQKLKIYLLFSEDEVEQSYYERLKKLCLHQ